MIEAVFLISIVAVGLPVYWWFRTKRAEKCILELLSEAHEPMYGLDLVKQSGGVLGRGTVYVLLNRLQERGLVQSTVRDHEGRWRYMLSPSAKEKQ